MFCLNKTEKYSDFKHEEWNEYEEFTVAVYHNDHMNGYIVGHKALNFFKIVCKFSQIPNKTICCSVRGCFNGVVRHRLKIFVIQPSWGPGMILRWMKKEVEWELSHTNDKKNK